MEQKDFHDLLETAVVAARLAGQRAMEELEFIKVSVKNDCELVTQADGRCQQIIINRVKERLPDHGFIGEEGEKGKIFKQAPRGGEDLWWVIDPIDGTNNFAHRILSFAVSIAVCCEGVPVVGVIFEPATDSMFTAFKDGESQLNGRRIVVNEEKLERFASVGFDSNFDEKRAGWIGELMNRTKYRNFGTTALQLAYVAKGSMVATIASNPKLWDVAAGAIIAETAGGIVTDWQGKKLFPADLDGYEGEQVQLLAANKKVQGELLEMLK